MDSANPFKQLGLPQNASVAEVRAAFRKIAKQTHPDKKSGSDQQFIDTVQAYKRAVRLADTPKNETVKVSQTQQVSPRARRNTTKLNAIVDFRAFLVALGSQIALLVLARMFM